MTGDCGGRPPQRPPTPAAAAALGAARARPADRLAVLLLALDLVVLYFTLRVCRLPASDVRMLPLVPLVAFFALLNGGYLALFTGAGGQTLGKMAAGVRVVSETVSRVSPGQAAGRTLLLAASLLPAGLGLVSVLVDRGRRGLHDRLSGTRVVRAAAGS